MRLSRWATLAGLLYFFVCWGENLSLGAALGKTFPTLTVGFTTYSNAVVKDISAGTVSLRHAGGIASLRIDSLEPDVLAQLGLEPVNPRQRRTSTGGATGASSSPANGRLEADTRTGSRTSSLKAPTGIVGVFLIAFLVGGVVLMIVGKVMFIVAAFRASTGWGVGVLLGALTLGIIPLIFWLTHLEETKGAVICTLAGFILALGVAVGTPNFVRAQEAAAQAASQQ